MLWLFVNIVPQLGCVSQELWCVGFLKEANSPGETRCKKSWDRIEKYGSLSLRYVKQVSGKKKDHRLEKYKSKVLISEVPTLWNLRTGPRWKTERQQRCTQSKAWNLAKNIYKLKEKTTRLHSDSPAEEWVLPVAETKEPEEREFCGGLRREHAYGQPERASSFLLSWRPRGHRGVLITVMTANGEVQTREEATVYVKELGCRFRSIHALAWAGNTVKVSKNRDDGGCQPSATVLTKEEATVHVNSWQ